MTQTIYEQRAVLQRQLDELDLTRAKAVRDIIARPAIQEALADLQGLKDPNDTTATHRSSASDLSALIANAIVPFENVPVIVEQHIQRLEARLAPPEPAPEEPEAETPPEA